jgi:hypothetical protein
LAVTIEELVDGEAGMEYVRQWARKEGKVYEPPARIADMMAAFLEFTDRDMDIIRGTIRGIWGRENKEVLFPPAAG